MKKLDVEIALLLGARALEEAYRNAKLASSGKKDAMQTDAVFEFEKFVSEHVSEYAKGEVKYLLTPPGMKLGALGRRPSRPS